MEFKSDRAKYLIFRNKSQYNKSAPLFGLNEKLLILKYYHRKGRWRFSRGEAGPARMLSHQWNVFFFETVHNTFIDCYLGKLIYLQGPE